MASSQASKQLYLEVRNPEFSDDGKVVYYEVCCMRKEPVPGKLQDVTYKWSFWKRYSEFQELDKTLRVQYGWRMKNIKLPPTKMIGNKDRKFIDKRCQALQDYLREVCSIENAVNFESTKCSKDLRSFLKYDEREKGMTTRTRQSTASKKVSRSYSTPSREVGVQDGKGSNGSGAGAANQSSQANSQNTRSNTVAARPPPVSVHQSSSQGQANSPTTQQKASVTPNLSSVPEQTNGAGRGGANGEGAGRGESTNATTDTSPSKPSESQGSGGGGRGDLLASIKSTGGAKPRETQESGGGRGDLLASIKQTDGAKPSEAAGGGRGDLLASIKKTGGSKPSEAVGGGRGDLMASIKSKGGSSSDPKPSGMAKQQNTNDDQSKSEETNTNGAADAGAPKAKSPPPASSGGGGSLMDIILQSGGKPSQTKKVGGAGRGRGKAAPGAIASSSAEKPIKPKGKTKSFKPKGPPPDKKNLLSAISQGKNLRKAETIDKSKPKIT